jgi:hypothetical protein
MPNNECVSKLGMILKSYVHSNYLKKKREIKLLEKEMPVSKRDTC